MQSALQSGDDSDGDDAMAEAGAAEPHKSAAPPSPKLRVQLAVNPADPTTLSLSLLPAPAPTTRPTAGREAETDSSPETSSSEESESEEESDGGEPLDYDGMKDLITKAYAAVDEEDEEDIKVGGRGVNALEALVGGWMVGS